MELRQFDLILFNSSLLLYNFSILSIIACDECEGIRIPVCPSMTTSLHPGILDAKEGTPIAPASIKDKPNPSLYEGNTNKFVIDKNEAIFDCGPVAMIKSLSSMIFFVISDTGLPVFSNFPISKSLTFAYFECKILTASTNSLIPLSLTIRPTNVRIKSFSLRLYCCFKF